MKSKKGFTLVEVIAVILVLAIISFIGFTIVSDVIDIVGTEKEVQNARTLSKMVSDYLVLEEMNGNTDIKNKYYVIKNDVEYTVQPDGKMNKSRTFKYRYKICDYCIIKIKDKNNYSILLEGKNQDVKGGSNINGVEVVPLEHSRNVTSNYNELLLFKDVYTSNNTIESTKFLEVSNNKIVEIDNSGNKTEIYTLTNSTGNGTIEITDNSNFLISVETEEKDTIEINSDNNVTIVDNVNKKDYSEDILNLYSALKVMAKRYIVNNTITEEVYFEFNNGDISIVDLYGEKVANNSVYIDKNLDGSGELRINTSGEIQVVIYKDNYDIKNDYGSEDLYNQSLKYERDNVILFRNLSRLELLAEKYLNGATSSNYKPSKSDWLVFYYIRQLSYTGSNWNTVSGSDSNFVTYVNNNSTYLKGYFKNKTSYTINGDTIDLRHLAAVMATLMYQTTTSDTYNTFLYQYEVDSVASWGGDLQTFMTDNILKDIGSSGTIAQYKEYTYNNLGANNTSFNMADMYGDVDAWVIYKKLIDGKLGINETFHKFYTNDGYYRYNKRFSNFKEILESFSGTTINSVVYKFTKKVYVDALIITVYWPLLENYTISSNMSAGVRDGFLQWINEKIAEEV